MIVKGGERNGPPPTTRSDDDDDDDDDDNYLAGRSIRICRLPLAMWR